jgi:hypothetical protein
MHPSFTPYSSTIHPSCIHNIPIIHPPSTINPSLICSSSVIHPSSIHPSSIHPSIIHPSIIHQSFINHSSTIHYQSVFHSSIIHSPSFIHHSSTLYPSLIYLSSIIHTSLIHHSSIIHPSSIHLSSIIHPYIPPIRKRLRKSTAGSTCRDPAFALTCRTNVRVPMVTKMVGASALRANVKNPWGDYLSDPALCLFVNEKNPDDGYNNPLESSSPSERVLSCGANTVTNKHCRLSPEMVNILVTLKENSELIDRGVVGNGKEEKIEKTQEHKSQKKLVRKQQASL